MASLSGGLRANVGLIGQRLTSLSLVFGTMARNRVVSHKVIPDSDLNGRQFIPVICLDWRGMDLGQIHPNAPV